MSEIADHVAEVMVRLEVVYGPPKTSNPEIFFAEYNKHLSGYSPAALEKAIDKITADNKYRSWPTIGNIREALGEVLRWEKYAKPPEKTDAVPPDWHEPTPEEKARVAALVDRLKGAVAMDRLEERVVAAEKISRKDFEDMSARTANGELHRVKR